MPSNGIEQRIRNLSPQKRLLLMKRLLGSRQPMPDAGHVNGVRLTAFLTTQASGSDSDAEPDFAELRDFLSRRLPEYMIPAAFRVLDSMPLLPNGKLDVSALRELPGEADEASGERWVEPRNATERMLADIWCDVLQMDSVSVHDNFFELGGDSILSIHIISRVNQQGLSLSPNDLFNFPTIAQLEARIRSVQAKNRPASAPTEIDEVTPSLPDTDEQSNDGASSSVAAAVARHPFIMVHAGSKMVSALRAHLDRDWPLYVLTATKHWEQADLDRYTTVERLAEENLVELRTLQPVGPYFLGGYSMGAPIALEMAHRLRAAGEDVKLLFLLDPPGRAASASRSGPPLVSSRNAARHLARISALPIAGKFRYVLVKAGRLARNRLLNRLRVFTRKRLIRPGATGLALLYRKLGLQVPTSWTNHYVGSVYTDAWRRYECKPYDGPVVIFHASRVPGDRKLWEGVGTGELTVECFEGKHLDFIRNHQLMNRWTARLVELLISYQTRVCAGASDPTAR